MLTRRRPEWGGVLLIGYRVIWLALFAAGLVAMGYFAPRDEIAGQSAYAAAAALGFVPFGDPSLQGQLGGPLGDEGRRIGYKNSDLLLTVDGHAVPADKTAQTRVLSGPTGSIAVLGLRHDTGERYTVRVARDPRRLAAAHAGWHISFQGRRWVQFGFETASTVAMLAAAALLFIRRPRDVVAQLLSFSIVLTYVPFTQLLHVALFVSAIVASLAQILLLTALLLFPDGRLNTRWHWLAALMIIAISVLSLINFWFSAAGNVAFLVYAATFAIIMLAVVTQYRRTPSGIARQQGKFVLFGIVAFCILEVTAWLLALLELYLSSAGALAWATLAAHVVGELAFIALPAGLLVSMLRYRLYDAETAISRSVVYGTLTLALLAIFAGSEKVIEILGEQYFGERLGALAGGLGAAFAAIMMVPLHHRVTHWAEHRFQGDLVHLRGALPVLVGDMGTTATPARLADTVLVRIEKGVRAAHAAIVVDHQVLAARDVDLGAVQTWLSTWREPVEDEGQLHANRDDPLFPMRVPLYADSVGSVGWILLGPRPDGSFYGKDERDTLLAIAEPVARAIVVARQREERDTKREERDIGRGREIGGLTNRMTAVETRLTGIAPQAA